MTKYGPSGSLSAAAVMKMRVLDFSPSSCVSESFNAGVGSSDASERAIRKPHSAKAGWNTSSAFSNDDRMDWRPSAVQFRSRVLNATAGAILEPTSYSAGRVYCQTGQRSGNWEGRAVESTYLSASSNAVGYASDVGNHVGVDHGRCGAKGMGC
jgi:hypothetical protein